MSDPTAPFLLGSVDTPGTAKGVDVEETSSIAVVADGPAGIQVVDFSDPANPMIVGGTDTGDARDVVLGGAFAFVADFASSFTSVDIGDPTNPMVRLSTPTNTGGLLLDVALADPFAFGADVFFVNGVPIIDITFPDNPVPRTILDFRGFRDDNGTGIAVDSQFVYLTASQSIRENGSVGSTRLYIGQYLSRTDTAGIPPIVSITSPAPGSNVIEEGTFPISVEATDDVAVKAVEFFVNGNGVFRDTSAPYQFDFTVPLGSTFLTLGATAVDFGNNIGTADEVVVNVIPDPLTTVIGQVVDVAGNPVGGATASTLNDLSAITAVDGTFEINGVPTVLGDIRVLASATVAEIFLEGRSVAVPPVPEGTTDVGTVVIVEKTSVLILHADILPFAQGAKDVLVSTGFFEPDDIVLIHQPTTTVTLEDLLQFKSVLVWSNSRLFDPDAVGDVLADYVEQGGGVVLATYVFSQPWRIGGRILDPGFSPFSVTNVRFTTSGTLDLANSDTTHSILAGVNGASYFANQNYTNPPLTEGATLIARDTNGNNLIAVNASNDVVGISIFVGAVSSRGIGDVGLIFANALNFVGQ